MRHRLFWCVAAKRDEGIEESLTMVVAWTCIGVVDGDNAIAGSVQVIALHSAYT